MSPDAIRSVAASVQPLIFETGFSDYPYTTGGTAFMVGFEGRAFALTARHCLNPDHLGPVCISPSDLSQRMLPLKDVFFVSSQWMVEEFTDLAAIEIDLTMQLDAELGCARIIDLARASGDWYSEADVSDFVVIGYPSEHSAVDYEHETILTERFALKGKYVGTAPQSFTHELEIFDTFFLSSLDGFSGGPVFAWTERPRRARANCALWDGFAWNHELQAHSVC